MKELVRKCCCSWEKGKCRLSSSLEGWGCRLLTCMPDRVPQTEREKAMLFSRIYKYAQSVGVLECPHYKELTIDKTLENKEQLRKMVYLEDPLQTNLLSDFYLQK